MKNTCSPRLIAGRFSPPDSRISGGFKQIGFGALALVSLGFSTQVFAHDRPSGNYVQTNLVSDVPGLAAATDPHLVNPWGLSASATSPWWVADNGTGLSTLYNGAGAIQALVVTVPNLAGETDLSAPTGMVFNGTATDFLVAPGKPSRFLFVVSCAVNIIARSESKVCGPSRSAMAPMPVRPTRSISPPASTTKPMVYLVPSPPSPTQRMVMTRITVATMMIMVTITTNR